MDEAPTAKGQTARDSPAEAFRMKVLRQYAVLDTGPEDDLDNLAALAATVCGTPIALITLVDVDRQWFKSKIGLEMPETPRSQSFCAHALDKTDVFIVPDATLDERFVNNPLVTGEPGIRFYAGAPLLTPENAVLGTICVIDRVPHDLHETQEMMLKALAQQVILKFDRHRRRAELGLDQEDELLAGMHDFTLEQLRSLVCTNPQRSAQFLRLLGFLTQPVLSQMFSYVYLYGPFLSKTAPPDESVVTLEASEPYSPKRFARLQEFFKIGHERMFDLCSIHLQLSMENMPKGNLGHDSFFQVSLPWQKPEGLSFPVVRIDLGNPEIIPQFRKAMDPFKGWKKAKTVNKRNP
jgi:hypothetical protein